MSASTSRTRTKPIGSVSLVAVGPGDPDLITLRAASLLRDADVVIADIDVVDLARMFVSDGTDVVSALDDYGLPLENALRAKLVADAAKGGRNVVRLFSGDPLLDGALPTEAAVLVKNKVAFDIAPGVSTLTGIPAYAGIGLLGGKAREVRVVDVDDPAVDWSHHVDPRVTIVVLGGADRIVEIARNCAPEDEEYKFAEMADKFGFENVRGGGCCKLFVRREPYAVRNFSRRVPDDLEYLTRAEIQDVVEKIKMLDE